MFLAVRNTKTKCFCQISGPPSVTVCVHKWNRCCGCSQIINHCLWGVADSVGFFHKGYTSSSEEVHIHDQVNVGCTDLELCLILRQVWKVILARVPIAAAIFFFRKHCIQFQPLISGYFLFFYRCYCYQHFPADFMQTFIIESMF